MRNVIIVKYKGTNTVAFVITCENHGAMSIEKLCDICKDFFQRLFYDYPVKVEPVTTIGNFTELHVYTSFGVRILDWEWVTNIHAS